MLLCVDIHANRPNSSCDCLLRVLRIRVASLHGSPASQINSNKNDILNFIYPPNLLLISQKLAVNQGIGRFRGWGNLRSINGGTISGSCYASVTVSGCLIKPHSVKH